MTKIDLVKAGRCVVCGIKLNKGDVERGAETCSLLCEQARAAGRSRDQQIEMMNAKGLSKKKRRAPVLVER